MPAIRAVQPVVAHHEILVLREQNLGGFQAEIRRQPAQVWLQKPVAVNEQHALREFHTLTWQPDDALHMSPRGHRDHNNIAPLRRRYGAFACPDQYVVPLKQSWRHALTSYPVQQKSGRHAIPPLIDPVQRAAGSGNPLRCTKRAFIVSAHQVSNSPKGRFK